MLKRIGIFIASIIVLSAIAAGYMAWNHLTPADFVRTPTGMLDEAIYAAQQNDLEAFKRSLTKECREYMEAINDSNINRDSAPRQGEDASLFWTWNSLMKKMAKQGGFEVLPASTKIYDYIADNTAKVYILYHDEDTGEERQKNYTLRREKGVWRIDLKGNPDFVQAYYQSVREFRKGGAPHEQKKDPSMLDNLF